MDREQKKSDTSRTTLRFGGTTRNRAYHNENNRDSDGQERVAPVKGAVDIPFLLITSALVLFGCVMI